MISLEIPGFGRLQLDYLILDYNGTLARDGDVLEEVKPQLDALANELELHVVTADTFGGATESLRAISCKTVVLPSEGQDVAKQEYIRALGAARSAAIGNGRNDALMIADAALGIAVIEPEGAAAKTLLAADVVCLGIEQALELLTNYRRLIATLRS